MKKTLKNILLIGILSLYTQASFSAQIASPNLTLKGLLPADATGALIKWNSDTNSGVFQTTLVGKLRTFETLLGKNISNQSYNTYQIFYQKGGKLVPSLKRNFTVLADEIKSGTTTYFYDISTQNADGKLTFADSYMDSYFANSCIGGQAITWQDGNIIGQTNDCLLIQGENVKKIQKTANIDPNLFENEFGETSVRCSQFGQLLDERETPIGDPICLKATSGTTSLQLDKNGNIITNIIADGDTYQFVYSEEGKLLAKIKSNKFQSLVQTQDKKIKVNLYNQVNGKANFIGYDDGFKFWNGIYFSPYIFSYKNNNGTWKLESAGNLGNIDEKTYMSVDPDHGTLRGIQTLLNGNLITFSNDFFKTTFDINSQTLGDIYQNDLASCGDMTNNISIFRYNENNISNIFSQINNLNDQYIIQGNFDEDGRVVIFPNQALEGFEPKTQNLGHFRYYISKNLGNLQSGTNSYEIQLLGQNGEKLCKDTISINIQ